MGSDEYKWATEGGRPPLTDLPVVQYPNEPVVQYPNDGGPGWWITDPNINIMPTLLPEDQPVNPITIIDPTIHITPVLPEDDPSLRLNVGFSPTPPSTPPVVSWWDKLFPPKSTLLQSTYTPTPTFYPGEPNPNGPTGWEPYGPDIIAPYEGQPGESDLGPVSPRVSEIPSTQMPSLASISGGSLGVLAVVGAVLFMLTKTKKKR
jgi:hypothetical protein